MIDTKNSVEKTNLEKDRKMEKYERERKPGQLQQPCTISYAFIVSTNAIEPIKYDLSIWKFERAAFFRMDQTRFKRFEIFLVLLVAFFLTFYRWQFLRLHFFHTMISSSVYIRGIYGIVKLLNNGHDNHVTSTLISYIKLKFISARYFIDLLSLSSRFLTLTAFLFLLTLYLPDSFSQFFSTK